MNAIYKVVGACFLLLAKIKNVLFGYTSPKPVSIDKCIEYDAGIVNYWLFFLTLYTEKKEYLAGKNVLELGPGAGLGTGLILLAKGALVYNAIDRNMLLDSVFKDHYNEYLEYLKKKNNTADIELLREELKKFVNGNGEKMNYVCRNDFDIASAFGEKTIDIVFSFATFEHFDDIEETARQLNAVCVPNAVIIVQIDLQTHSRWISKKDPNNIYRYSDTFYRFVSIKGSPNRLRPYKYKEAFSKNGWSDVKISPLTSLDNELKTGIFGLNRKFKDPVSQMDCLSVMLCARKI